MNWLNDRAVTRVTFRHDSMMDRSRLQRKRTDGLTTHSKEKKEAAVFVVVFFYKPPPPQNKRVCSNGLKDDHRRRERGEKYFETFNHLRHRPENSEEE